MRLRPPLLMATTALVLAGCGAAADDDAPAVAADGQEAGAGDADDPLPSCDRDTIRFADTQVEALEELSRRFEPFAAELERALGREIEFYSVPDRNAAATALEFNDVDLVLAGAAEYVVLNAVADAQPIVALTRDEYYSVIAVHADSDIEELDDLQGRSVAIGSVGSGTRHIAPMRILVEDGGFDPESDLDVVYLDDAWREAFIAGEVEAIGLGSRHLEPVVEELGEENVRTIFEGPNMGHDAFMVDADLGEDCADEIRQALLANEDALLEAIWDTADDTDNDKYLESALREVDDSDYDTMREAFLAIGVDDFAAFDEDELEREIEEQQEDA
jgi:phosphonate transport system substrate-binding protein